MPHQIWASSILGNPPENPKKQLLGASMTHPCGGRVALRPGVEAESPLLDGRLSGGDLQRARAGTRPASPLSSTTGVV